MTEIDQRVHQRVSNALYGLWRELESEGVDMTTIPVSQLSVSWDGDTLEVVNVDAALAWEKVYEEPPPPEPEPEPIMPAEEEGGFAGGGVVLA